MHSSRDLLFTLLRAAFGHPFTPPQPPFDWAEVYRLASAQGVLAIAWDGLQQLLAQGLLSTEQGPTKTGKLQWAFNVEEIEQRAAQRVRLIQELASFYQAHQIRMMLLKGYGLSLCYPIPAHRPYGDIDIWLFGEQERADELLALHRGVKIHTEKHHHTTFQLKGILVENHYDFLNIHSHRSNREIEQELKRLANEETSEKVRLNSIEIELPSPNFNALFLLRHAAAHFAADDIGIRHLIDWALFIKRYHNQIHWKWLEQITRTQHMEAFLFALNAIAIDHLGLSCELIPPFSRNLELENKVLHEILSPNFSEPMPTTGGVFKRINWKLRRWWAHRWKHRIVYKEGLLQTFLTQVWSHLLKPKSI